MSSAKPSVVIVCPDEFTFTDESASVEQPILDQAADVKTVRLAFNAPLPTEVLNADALILWHGPQITAVEIARMKRCRAIIRNGVGFDSVDTKAAAAAGIVDPHAGSNPLPQQLVEQIDVDVTELGA